MPSPVSDTHDRHAGGAERRDDRPDRLRPDQRDIDRHDQKAIRASALGVVDSRQQGGQLATLGRRVYDEPCPGKSGNGGAQSIVVWTSNNEDSGDAASVQRPDDGCDEGLISRRARKQSLGPPHSAGLSRREHRSDDADGLRHGQMLTRSATLRGAHKCSAFLDFPCGTPYTWPVSSSASPRSVRIASFEGGKIGRSSALRDLAWAASSAGPPSVTASLSTPRMILGGPLNRRTRICQAGRSLDF
jgi:hypothetical protein